MGGFAAGERDGAPLQIQQIKVEIYHPRSRMKGSVDGKLISGNIKAKETVAKPM